ncbi:hemerythrin domain-containing protein [Actinocorallia sp. A-T 12471]|uniref:hemerythrin domain-containing protein n=1 Tax=Actinocorallia sp. A-T 12471 TaxID=3089813 RepID=UPI0029CED264|nr:hemerythrin domain-containing protein [Actinocorallia sp. A-T 12471]MDX6743511.1 hemerythrin domain-containing protein [Actinocorallia sp. A-T 12471]
MNSDSARRVGGGEPDLTIFTTIHRGMRAEVRRLADLTAAQGDAPFPPEREAALRRHLDSLLHEIHAHHASEDEIVWPVIVAAAGAAIDLAPLTDDHGAIDPCLDRVRAARGTARAKALADLRDLLDEHITEEEATVFPIVRRYLTAEQWAACEARIRKGAKPSHLRWLVPFIAASCEPADRARLLADAGAPMRLVLRLFGPSYARLLRAVYGS